MVSKVSNLVDFFISCSRSSNTRVWKVPISEATRALCRLCRYVPAAPLIYERTYPQIITKDGKKVTSYTSLTTRKLHFTSHRQLMPNFFLLIRILQPCIPLQLRQFLSLHNRFLRLKKTLNVEFSHENVGTLRGMCCILGRYCVGRKGWAESINISEYERDAAELWSPHWFSLAISSNLNFDEAEVRDASEGRVRGPLPLMIKPSSRAYVLALHMLNTALLPYLSRPHLAASIAAAVAAKNNMPRRAALYTIFFLSVQPNN